MFNQWWGVGGKNRWFDTLRADPSSSRQRQVCLQCLLVGWRVDKYIKATSVTAFSANNEHTHKTHTGFLPDTYNTISNHSITLFLHTHTHTHTTGSRDYHRLLCSIMWYNNILFGLGSVYCSLQVQSSFRCHNSGLQDTKHQS